MRKLLLTICILATFLSLQAGAGAVYETGGVTKQILANGVTLLIHPEEGSRVAAIQVFIRTGAADETPANAGIGQLLAGSILAGTTTHSNIKLARLVSGVGGNIHSIWQWNYLEVHAVTLPSFCEEAISLIADSIKNSRLDSVAIEYSRSSILKQIKEQEEDPFNKAYTAIRGALHNGGIYGRSYLGSPSALQAISRNQIADFYERNFSADRIVISVVGDVDPASVERQVGISFGNMPRFRTHAQPTQPQYTPREISIESTTPASYVMVGYPAPGLDGPDYAPMCVANVLLGGNKSSLLFTELRERQGIGYQVGSLYPALRWASHLVAYVGLDAGRCTPETVKSVKETILHKVAELRSGAFSDADLMRAKGYLIGRHALSHERTRDRAFALGWAEAIGLGYQSDFLYADRVRAVTREDVLRAAKKYLKDPSTITLLGRERANN